MSKGLSDKAKGKQRAVEPIEEPSSRELMVRFTEGVPDLTIRVQKRDSVRDVKNNVCPCALLIFFSCLTRLPKYV